MGPWQGDRRKAARRAGRCNSRRPDQGAVGRRRRRQGRHRHRRRPAHDAAIGYAVPASGARRGYRDLSGRRGHERRLERHRRDHAVFGQSSTGWTGRMRQPSSKSTSSTTDGSRVKFDSLAMEVQSSDAYRKPMLSLVEHQGCVGFRPSFSFKNNGWGDVRDVKMSVQFTGERPDETAASRIFTKQIGTFGNGTDVFARRPDRRSRRRHATSSPANVSPASRWTASGSARARSSTRSASARSPISYGATRSCMTTAIGNAQL